MTRPRVAIVDTGSGNLRSVEKALAEAGADAQVTARRRGGESGGQGGRARPGCVRRLRGGAGPGRGRVAPGGAGVDPRSASRTWACAWGCRSCSTAATSRRTAPVWASCPDACAGSTCARRTRCRTWAGTTCGAGRPPACPGWPGRPTARTSISSTATTRSRPTRRTWPSPATTAARSAPRPPGTTCWRCSSTRRRARRRGSPLSRFVAG